MIDSRAQDIDTHAVRDFNDYLRDDPRVDLIMLPIGDGITICYKKSY